MKFYQYRALNRLLLGVSAAAIASAALAQTAPPAAAPGASSPTTLGEIVITGSRVIHNGNASPAPMTVVSVGEIQALQPGPIVEAISYLPVMAGSKGLTGNPGTGVTNTAANVLNLRNLGFPETLVLFDGKRIAPSTYDQLVDSDAIPQMLLQHVDVVTGGVGAVYGSDAVAGVVNFVTDKKFNGLKFDVESGISTYGDEKSDSIGLAVGRRFLKNKAHIEFSYEYRNDPGVDRRSDRAWGRNVWAMEGAGTAASPSHLVENTRFTSYTYGGLITSVTGAAPSGVASGQIFAQNGVLSPFVHGASTGSASFESGGSGAYYDASIKDAQVSNKGFGRLDYDFSDDLHGFVEGADSINHTLNYGAYNQFANDTFSGTNAFLPAAYQFGGTFKLSEMLQQMSRIDTNTRQNQAFVLAGLDGTLLTKYKWEVGFNHSSTNATTRDDNNINNQNLAAALDAVVNPANGQVVCRASLTNTAYSNCVPLNVFGPTAANGAALAYITQPTSFTVNNALDSVSGSITGSPISDWAGPINVALSGEWRNQSFSVQSTALPSDLANCTSLTYNCTATTAHWADATVANRPRVSEHVSEGAIETDVPLIKDLPWVKNLSFNGAARYTDYSVIGSAWTWKAGLVWQVDDDLKLRATRSRDIRAPNLYELYQPSASSTAPHQDYLTNLSVQVPTISSGNPKLTPELGDTSTAGFVYQPHALPGFSFSVDAYYIDISNAIVSELGYSVTGQNVCYASGGTSPFCSLIVRPGPITNTSASNAATGWLSTVINANDVKTYGADFETSYATRVFDNPLNVRALLTWQPHHITASPGLATTEDAGLAFFAYSLPVLRLNLIANYKVKDWEFGVEERWRSTLNLEANAGQVYSGVTDVASTAYTDINIHYHLKTWSWGDANLFFNVKNLFNLQPPPAAGVNNGSAVGTFGGFVSGDDPIGRYFTMGMRFRY